MNVNDVHDSEVPVYDGSTPRYAMIFARQRELMEKYHHIEKANGLLQTEACPVDLHDRFGQARIKDFAWRVTEEIAEATEALGHDPIHFIEELSDALHFLVELTLLAGYDHMILDAGPGRTDALHVACIAASIGNRNTPKLAYDVIEQLGLMCNTLKNKPHKTTHVLTDIPRFKQHLEQAHFAMICLLVKGGSLNADQILSIYFKKSEVNRFRIRSDY